MEKISKIIQKRFANVFVAIVSEKNEYVVRYIVVKKDNIVAKDEKRFPMDEEKKLSSDIKEFLLSLQKGYKFIYISYLLDSLGQGCIPTCVDKEMESYNIDKSNIFQVCVENSWTTYASKADIKWTKSIFNDIGLDFIFSPYIVLNNFINKEKHCNKTVLHFLYMENSITILIFDGKKLIFNAFFKIPYKEFSFEEDEELKPESSTDITDGIELDNIESEEDEFEGFVDITKLDDDSNDNEEEDDILNSAKEDIESSTLEDLELYGREMIIFKYLHSAIEEYYKNDRYESEFLEDIIIYNDSNISNDIITMIENDLFLNVEIHSVDVKEEMINMSIEEVDF